MAARDWFGQGQAGQRHAGRISAQAAVAVQRTVRAGAANYERTRDLPKLARLDPRQLSAETLAGVEAIVSVLRRALRAERNRARSGHWTYDLNRHIALRQAYLAESERLEMMKAKGAPKAKFDVPSIPSIFNVFMTSLDIVEMRVARSRLAGDPADVLITPLLPDFATMDFHRAREAIDEGRAAVERMGPLLQQVLG